MIDYRDLWDLALKQTDALLAKFKQLEAENESLRDKVDALNLVVDDKQYCIEDLRADLWTVKAKLDESRDESVAVSMDHARLAKQLSETQEHLANHQRALVDERCEYQRLESSYSSLAQEMKLTMDDLDAANRRIKELEASICNCLRCESLRR